MLLMCSGLQRSGKTALAVYICRKLKEQGYFVYTNMVVDGFITIKNITEVPPNSVLLLDELPNLMDSRNYKNFTDITIWFNTLRKRNIHFICTSIRPEMVDLRVRQQLEYVIYSRGDNLYLNYRCVDIQSKNFKDFNIKKNIEFFSYLNYNTKQIPNMICMDVKDWINNY